MGIIKRLKVYNVSLGEERERERFQIPNSEWSFPWRESMIELQVAVRWCGETTSQPHFCKTFILPLQSIVFVLPEYKYYASQKKKSINIIIIILIPLWITYTSILLSTKFCKKKSVKYNIFKL